VSRWNTNGCEYSAGLPYFKPLWIDTNPEIGYLLCSASALRRSLNDPGVNKEVYRILPNLRN
jgi:hypothetical protein